MKDYWKYEKTHTRKDLLKLCWMCSVPIAGWIALIYVMIFKPHKKGGRWKRNAS